jgi:pyrroloquinoline quinone (PQQ) biosynthesis protein C
MTTTTASDAHNAIAAAVRSITANDGALAALDELTLLRHTIERLTLEQVGKARREGATWQQLGDALGVSRQSAHERFGK